MDKEDALSMYVYIYSILYIYKISNIRHKKNEIMSFAVTWMDLVIIMLREATQKKQINDIAYMWNPKKKKKIQMNLFTKQKGIHRLRKQTRNYQKGKGVLGGIN